MKTPEPDDESVLYGSEAADHLTRVWDQVGLGKVGARLIDPWLIVDRSGSDWRAFISLVDDSLVTIMDGDATTRHVPKQYRPDEDVPSGKRDLLGRAFEGIGGGMYPTTDESRFQINFKEDGDRKVLNIGLTSDRMWVSDL